MEKEKTIYEKWDSDSAEPNGGIRFHKADPNAKPVEFVGFSEEDMREIFGEGNTEEIDTIEEVKEDE